VRVFIPAIGDLPYKEKALVNIRGYWRSLGIEPYILEEWPAGFVDRKHKSWGRLLCFDILGDDDDIMALGLDVVPMPWAPDIRDYIKPDVINACIDCSVVYGDGGGPGGGWPPVEVANFWFNADLMYYPRSMAQWVKDEFKKGPNSWETGEQYIQNYDLARIGHPIHHLPIEFNMFWNKNLRKKRSWFVHYTMGCPNNAKLEAMEDMPVWGDLGWKEKIAPL
jgi:hypothetical protein